MAGIKKAELAAALMATQSLMEDQKEASKPALKRIQAIQAQRQQQKAQEQQMSLLFPASWPEQYRGIPNELVRCALFNVRNKTAKREFMKDVELACFGQDTRITYFGEELRQEDETVWMQMIHMAKEQNIGDTVYFTPYSMCKALGWAAHKKNYARIVDCLTRMQGNAIKVFSSRLLKMGLGEELGRSISMVKEFAWVGANGEALTKYEVVLDMRLARLFGGNGYTRVEWKQRLSLPVGLCSWLHSFYSSHRNPIPVKVEELHRISGSESSPKLFKSRLREAMDSLVEVGFVVEWFIDKENFLHVSRTGKLLEEK